MPPRVVGVLVHAEDDHDVLAGRRGGGDHLLRAAVDVRPDAGRVGTDAGGLDDHVHAHLAPTAGRSDPSDGRAVLVRITEAGRRIGRSRHDDRTRRLEPLLARSTPLRRRETADALPP
ncbi:hypothetical protein GCM10010317_063610 [Streptomyces mirabilis]|uniref:hypothetical protein n=1 Tax=Streptomyces mirabilis TaxID=68239 RepID=UPI00167E9BA4|nr:hypothetical protein [Streptomyces mirabilis]GHD64773.1 hypothetical protein GCM10010317_063610 [Streptomyces mirabilis]